MSLGVFPNGNFPFLQHTYHHMAMSPFLYDHCPPRIESPATLDAVVKQHFAPARVKDVYSLPNHLHTLCLVVLSNGHQLLLKSPPRPTTPLLRHEQSLLRTEITVIALLRQSGVPFIPAILHHERHTNLSDSAVLIRPHVAGRTRQEMEDQLSDQDRDVIDRQLGALAWKIGQHTSRSFGTFHQVERGRGKSSWKEAFLSLVEGTLRDAEDAFVNLPYAEIRSHIHRLSPALEEITLPQLVLVDLGCPSQVILNPEDKAISGLVDFSYAVWGDVYMAQIFDEASAAVLEGYGSWSGMLATGLSRPSQCDTFDEKMRVPRTMRGDD
ncbi:conserved hypothetical protein [Aspergillus terreus NIH2624]|uniref:Aminoglycoside phosphotransferase domain-containing protein n=1 Tax=Aspergillus terreus (strain NIH 2624 / FGSC A1156) TaxID=341663 RepID=Q0CNV3_ASPTN|nr:uncharacterized protein ATEG_04631 [Aspergillus terreus NIH2624]EAU35078.1 conserved hypothetical protein [Aspergillus terreus NIH2624]